MMAIWAAILDCGASHIPKPHLKNPGFYEKCPSVCYCTRCTFLFLHLGSTGSFPTHCADISNAHTHVIRGSL